jgi:hypothetical protein
VLEPIGVYVMGAFTGEYSGHAYSRHGGKGGGKGVHGGGKGVTGGGKGDKGGGKGGGKGGKGDNVVQSTAPTKFGEAEAQLAKSKFTAKSTPDELVHYLTKQIDAATKSSVSVFKKQDGNLISPLELRKGTWSNPTFPPNCDKMHIAKAKFPLFLLRYLLTGHYFASNNKPYPISAHTKSLLPILIKHRYGQIARQQYPEDS